jgi:hypothetical protein
MNEILSKRTRNSKTYDVGNGKRQLITTMHSQHYHDGVEWKDIDTNWEFETGYGYKVQKAAYHLRNFDQTLRFGFSENTYVDYLLPQQIVSFLNSQGYFDISSDVRIQYNAVSDGLKLEVILNRKIPNRNYSFPIVLNNCTATLENNSLIYRNLSGDIVGSIPNPYMVDANGDVGNVILAYDGIKVTLTPDYNWLKDAVYPVVIDPTTSIRVGANADSGYTFGSALVTTAMRFGSYVGMPTGVFSRFLSVGIPQGVTIDNAKVTFTADSTDSANTCITRIYGNDVDDSVAPTTAAEYAALGLTSAFADWTLGSWTNGSTYDTPEIKTIIKEIVDRPSWVSGNDITILVKDNGSTGSVSRIGKVYQYAPASAPLLVVTYTEGTPDALITIPSPILVDASLITPLISVHFIPDEMAKYRYPNLKSSWFNRNNLSGGASNLLRPLFGFDVETNIVSSLMISVANFETPILTVDSGAVNVSIDGVVATSSADAIIPTVSAIRNISISAVVSTADADSVVPTVQAIQNVSIDSPVSAVTASGVEPTISAIQNVNIQGVVATSNATAISPTVQVIQNVSISSVVASVSADSIAPTVQTTTNIDISATVSTVNSDAYSPTVTTTRNVNIQSVVATSNATFNNPSLSVGGSISIPAEVAISNAEFIVPSISAVRNTNITSTTGLSTADFIAPSILVVQNVSILPDGMVVVADAVAPSIQTGGSINISVGSLIASGIFNIPTISAIRNVSISVPVSGIVCSAINPIVSSGSEIQILCEVMNSVADMSIPSILAIKNLNIQTPTATSQSTFIVPQIVVAGNISITSEVMIASALLLEPNVVSGTDINIQSIVATTNGELIAPTIYTVRNTIILPNSMTANAIFVVPSIDVIDLRKASIEVSYFERNVLLTALRYKGYSEINYNERDVGMSIEERLISTNSTSRKVEIGWL